MSIKPGHDGTIAFVKDQELKFSIEAEKGGHPRYSPINQRSVLAALELCDTVPDVFAISGWSHDHERNKPIEAGYVGLDTTIERKSRFFGQEIDVFSSSHERSHLMCAHGLSPFPLSQPCLGLVWEGHIGAIYYCDPAVAITKIGDVLIDPGIRFGFLYALADPTFPFPERGGAIRLGDAGKLTALKGYASSEAGNHRQASEFAEILLNPALDAQSFSKEKFSESIFHDCGVTDPNFANLVCHVSDEIYRRFETALETATREFGRLPLLVAGGCALNCEWNSRLIESGLFEDVFIPPCANDTGSAIGTALDALHHYSGTTKISWSPYSGEAPIHDIDSLEGFTGEELNLADVAHLLARGGIIGWIRGKYEIGPRALGARSLLAAASDEKMLQRLNDIKQRETFRPIAPVCLEEDMTAYFEPSTPSPHMLQLRRVISNAIPAVTHVDGSARVQSVSFDQNPELHSLLKKFREITNVGVLCNTSLNFKGLGFINKLSDALNFAKARNLDAIVFDNLFFKNVKEN